MSLSPEEERSFYVWCLGNDQKGGYEVGLVGIGMEVRDSDA